MTSKMLDFLQEDKKVPTNITNEIILKKKDISAETRAYINNFRDKGFAEALRRMDAYNPRMRAARRSPVPPRAQDQSQGASQGSGCSNMRVRSTGDTHSRSSRVDTHEKLRYFLLE